jgi:plastocyanin
MPSKTLLAAFLVTTGTFLGCGPAARDPVPSLSGEAVSEIRAAAAKGKGAAVAEVKKTGEGWGNLAGTIRLTGAATPKQLTAHRGTAFCGDLTIPDDSLITGPGNGLKNVLVYLRTSAAISDKYNATAADEVPLDNKNCRFEPHVATVRVGQTLLVKNSDNVGHNTKVGSLFNPTLPVGSVERIKFTAFERSTTPISCSIHPWMSAHVMILDHPYMRVTDNSGKFTMPDLPAGVELEFQIWHERASGGLSGSSKTVNLDARGRFKVTIPKDQTLSFELTVPVGALQ